MNYVLLHDDQLFVDVAQGEIGNRSMASVTEATATWHDAGYEATLTRTERAAGSHFGHWWTCTVDLEEVQGRGPDTVTLHFSPRREVAAYRRTRDGVGPEAQYPGTLPKGVYEQKADDESVGYDPILPAIYEPVWREVPVEPIVINDGLRLAGEPPTQPPDGAEYRAKLPYDLMYTAGTVHLFPGTLHYSHRNGFAGVLADELSKDARVQYAFVESPGLKLTVKAGLVARQLHVNVPHQVAGTSMVDAIANAGRIRERVLAQVGEITDAVCPACNGSGTTLPPPVEKRPRRRR